MKEKIAKPVDDTEVLKVDKKCNTEPVEVKKDESVKEKQLDEPTIPQGYMLVPTGLIKDAVNVLIKDHGEEINTYNGLVEHLLVSGNIKINK